MTGSTKRRGQRGGPKPLHELLETGELQRALHKWATTNECQAAVGAGVALAGLVGLLADLFALLIPATYAVGGWLLYRKRGWRFFQPGVGGRSFVALNGAAWWLYAVSLLLHVASVVELDPLLRLNSFLAGMLSFALLLIALFVYQPPQDEVLQRRRGSSSTRRLQQEQEQRGGAGAASTFNAELQHSVLMRASDSSPSAFWWVFIGLQAALVLAAFIVCLGASLGRSSPGVRMVSTTVSMWALSSACATTHALGGKWRHLRSSYSTFQPGRGGRVYVLLQAAGWGSLGLALLAGLFALAGQGLTSLGGHPAMPSLPAWCGTLGVVAEMAIFCSLFAFEEDTASGAPGQPPSKTLLRFGIWVLNTAFGPADPEAATRAPTLHDPDAHHACTARWEAATRDCKQTGECYLVVGCGFVGKRIVNALLKRGESRVRVMDVAGANPWAGDDRVTFIRGDVTRADHIGPACEGVSTIYATFAVIRFMDRLAHQAKISYHVNVRGTEALLDACRAYSVRHLVVTSSSHATTDGASLPRLGRDESAPLVDKRSAHNHYGWTKALADRLALEAHGSPLASGGALEVVVIRPCSGVFGADDRLSFQRVMDSGLAPGVGASAVMDWVYVDNVVLGHLLAEKALRDGAPGVGGEAFCISNEDPMSMQDFWCLTRKMVARLPCPEMRKRLALDFVWIPEAPLWALAYVSEAVQWLFKGRVSLGRDLDMLTPPMMQTATMTYAYSSRKASQRLGYRPVFSVEEGIQRALHDYHKNNF